MPISKSRSAILGGTSGATSLAEEKQWSIEVEADVAAVDAKVKAFYATRAEFLSTTLAELQADYGSSGSLVANVRETGAIYYIDLAQSASFDFTTSGGVEVTMRPAGRGAVSSEQIEAPENFSAGRFAQLLSGVRPIEFGAGEFPIESQVTFPTSPAYGGGFITGAGKAVSDRSAARSANAVSRIAWTGTAVGTMLRVPGSAGLTFENLAFSGISGDGASNNAGVGIQIASSPSTSSGVSSFRSVSFHDFDIAIQCGEARSDGNCADIDFNRVTSQDCGTFLKVLNDQGVNYVFPFAAANFTDRFVHCVRGGNVYIHAANFAGCGATNWVVELENIGDSTYGNLIANTRLEQNTKRLCKTKGGSVLIENLTEAQNNQAVRMFDFTGTSAVIRNARLITHDSTNPTIYIAPQTGGHVGSLLLDGVFFDTETWDFNDWVQLGAIGTAHPVITMRGCRYGAAGKKIADFSTDTAYGPARVKGNTSGATTAILTQFGNTRSATTGVSLRADTIQTFEIDIIGLEDTGDIACQARRLATTKNDGGTSSLLHQQAIGTDHNPFSLSVAPTAAVSDGFDILDINCTGQTGRDIAWSATVREVETQEI